jgi:hypothetical protein
VVLVDVPVHAAAFRAESALKKEQLVEQADLFLCVHSEGPLLGQVLRGNRIRSLVDVSLAREKVGGRDPADRELSVLILDARRRAERPTGSRRLVVVDGVEVPVEHLAPAVPFDRRPWKGLGTLKEELVWRPEVVVLLERIDAGGGDETQTVVTGPDCVVIEREATSESVRLLVVHAQLSKLDRVGLNSPVGRQEVAVRVPRGQVDKARRIRERVSVTSEVVTVVVPATLVLSTIVGRCHPELRSLAEGLANVGSQVLATEPSPELDASIPFPGAAYEVARVLVATTDIDSGLMGQLVVAEDLLVVVEIRRWVAVEPVRDTSTVLRGRLGQRPAAALQLLRAGEYAEPLPCVHAGRAALAALGRDDHDAVGGLGAVDR